MKSLDLAKHENEKIIANMHEAFKSDDEKQFAEAFTAFVENLQVAILAEAKELVDVTDQSVLASRGIRQLTSKEKNYFQKLGEAMKSNSPKAELAGIEEVLPKTTIDEVFDYLTEAHPLLDKIDFQNTAALVEMLRSTSNGVAIWGELCSDITAELGGAFQVVNLTLAKLSAYMPACNAMLDLGPVWLERWVRTILAEAIAVGLEAGIVDGDGKNGPIGMTRKLSGAVDGVYPHKSTVKLTSFDPVSLASILDTVSKAPNDKRRAIPSLLMVVNPADYFTKVFPSTTVRRTDGGWNNNVFPYPVDVVQSNAIPENHAVIGLGKAYFMGLGIGKGGKIEHSDDVRFLQDQRVYRVKLYGNGRADDENAFVYADITNLKPTLLQVEVKTSATPEA